MGRIYDITLECGCMIANDTGTPDNPNGDGGMIPCYAEEGDMTKKEDRKALELHIKCMKEYLDTFDEFSKKNDNY